MQNVILTPVSVDELVNLIATEVEFRIRKDEPTIPQQDQIEIDEAVNLTGFRKSAIYRLSMLGEIPCSRFRKKLVFSRKELEQWIKDRTIRKTGQSSNIRKHLQKVADEKL